MYEWSRGGLGAHLTKSQTIRFGSFGAAENAGCGPTTTESAQARVAKTKQIYFPAWKLHNDVRLGLFAAQYRWGSSKPWKKLSTSNERASAFSTERGQKPRV